MPGEVTTAHPESKRPRRRAWSPHALPAPARPGVLAALWAALLIYGSLLPFDLQLTSIASTPAEGLLSLGHPDFASFSRVDLVTNLLLYVPLGVLLRIALGRQGLSRAAQVVFGVLAVLLLSVSMEYLQAYSPSRVASLMDVGANTAMGAWAVVFAPWGWALARRVIFAGYCRLAWPIHAARVRLRFLRRSPRVLLVVALCNAVLLVAWYATQATNAWGPAPAAAHGETALPFERHFAHAYDHAALLLGRSLLVYAAVGCLLALTMLRTGGRAVLRRVVLGVILAAVSVELYRSRTAPASFRADLTEPIIAAGAALLMGITAYLFAHAVRRANRRQRQTAYDGPERRRVRHRYADKASSVQ